jgi:hypothetical protein
MGISDESKAVGLFTALTLYFLLKGPETYTKSHTDAIIQGIQNPKDTINYTITDESTIRSFYLNLNGKTVFSEQLANPYRPGPKEFNLKIPVPKGMNKVEINYETGIYTLKKIEFNKTVN